MLIIDNNDQPTAIRNMAITYNTRIVIMQLYDCWSMAYALRGKYWNAVQHCT